jgi:2-dehydro-3-deoxyphosphooctonate aldolase (KDO 8-P synthase)
MKNVPVKDFFIGKKQPLAVMTGPCVIESEDHALFAAEQLANVFRDLGGMNFIYKSSYDKANRSARASFRGPGLEKGLKILERVKKEFDVPVITDVHSPEEAMAAGEVCDILQIPAFLCRQTDLIEAAAKTGIVINVKKGQFMAPWDMRNVVEKITASGNEKIILTDRGTSFGYNNLVSDMRAVPIMQKFGFPVCFDASHSVQLPGGLGNASGGQREFIPTLARAAIAAGCNCLFIESHPDPSSAKSDKDSVYPLAELPRLLSELERIYRLVQFEFEAAETREGPGAAETREGPGAAETREGPVAAETREGPVDLRSAKQVSVENRGSAKQVSVENRGTEEQVNAVNRMEICSSA